jgi:hypothetical protein
VGVFLERTFAASCDRLEAKERLPEISLKNGGHNHRKNHPNVKVFPHEIFNINLTLGHFQQIPFCYHRGFESLPIRHIAVGRLQSFGGMENTVRAVRQVATATNPSPSAIPPSGA